MTLIGAGRGGGAAAFVGALDGTGDWEALWGYILLLSDYAGPLAKIGRDSDNASDDFGPVAATGIIDLAAITAFLSGANPYVLKVYDQTGNGIDLPQATVSKCPAFTENGVNDLPCMTLDGSDDVLIATSISITIGAAFAVANSTRGTTFPNFDGLLTGLGESTNMFLGLVSSSNLWQTNTAAYPFYGNHYVDGVLGVAFSPLSTVKLMTGEKITPVSETQIRIGRQNDSAGQRQWKGEVYAAGIRATAFGGDLHNTIGTALSTLYGTGWTAPWASRIVAVGDSITSGYGLSDPATQSYPAQVQTGLGPHYTMANKGHPSWTINDLETDAANIDALYVAGSTNILCVFIGTNDLYFGNTGVEAYTELVSYCQDRQAAGWLVVVLTMLPRGNGDGNFETYRGTFNSSVVTNWATFADALADVAANGTIGDAGDENDTTYYQDTIHPTAAGATIIAGIVGTAIGTL